MEMTDVAERISRVEERERSNTKRIDALEKQTEAIQTLATNVAVMAQTVKTTGEKVDGLCEDVQEIKAKPGKRWDAITLKIIEILLAAVIGYVLAKLGLS